MEIRDCDVRVDIYRGGHECGMRLTHIPTGTVVSGSGISQIKLRKELLAELAARLSPKH